MLFNSLEFALFLPIVFILYWFVVNKNLRVQNFFLLLVSYFFYGWWDWRFLSLIIFSSFVDFFIGNQLGKNTNEKQRKGFLWISILVNLGFLGFFKYRNFFIDSFNDAFTFFGSSFDIERLQIILPVGISFYTFQTLSYTIDVYKGKLKPTNDIIAFFAFVSFFPQLVAGPIEKANNFLPQFFKKRQFEYDKAVDGLRQILWGLFQKVVIADGCAEIVNQLFNHPDGQSGSNLLLGAVLFTVQIYGDFAGYSNIAIGTGRLFGFNLMQNFNFPYFAKNITEFWRKWHISLSGWFREYLFQPLIFRWREWETWGGYATIFVTFTIIGFWHGPNWNFVIFGSLHALALMFEQATKKRRKRVRKKSNSLIYNGISIFLTLSYWTFTLIFFRTQSLGETLNYLSGIFSTSLFSVPTIQPLMVIALIAFLFVLEWKEQVQQYALEKFGLNWHRLIRWGFYLVLIVAIFKLGGQQQEFIYFQF